MKKNLLNNWEVVEKIGQGNNAEVYKAYKKVDGIPLYCAVKHISLKKSDKETETIVNNLKKEVTFMQKFNGNKYIINYLNSYKETSLNKDEIDCYIYMELAEDIEKYFNRVKISPKEVLKMGIDITQALEACQDLKIIHRDIKPSNIYKGTDGNFKLGDFGSATLLDSKKEDFVGTYNYVSPEIYKQQKANFTSDIYSLGLVMYKLLNEKLPFVDNKTNEVEALKKRMSGKALPKINNLNPKIMNIINKMCAFNIDDRYQSPTELGKDLKQVHFEIAGITKIKEGSSYDKTVSIQEMKKLEDKEKHSLKYLFNYNKNKLSKYKSKIKIILGIIILIIIIILLLVACNKEEITCEEGYIVKNSECVKGYYTCEEDYTLNGDQCEKIVETTEATPNLSCEDGYELEEEMCVKTDEKDAENGYYCSTGYTLNGEECQIQDTKEPVVSSNCPSGYTLYDNKCISLDYQSATTSYSCPTGYTLSGTTCTKTESNSTYLKTRTTCPDGGTLSDNTCHITADATISWFYPYYSCDSGYQYSYSDRKCHKYYTPTTTKYCEKGTISGSTCVITTTVAATLNYQCPSGYDLYGNQCAKTSAIVPEVTYTCDTGYTLSDNICTRTVSVDASYGYHCDTGYTLEGSKCILNSVVAPTVEYQCTNGYTLRDDECVKLETTDATPHYEDEETDSN